MKTLVKVGLFVLGAFLLVGVLFPVGYKIARSVWNWGVDQKQESIVCPVCPVGNSQEETFVPESEYIQPANRVESGAKVGYGTLTFDSETRVWVLSKFIVPSTACYAFDYSGREKGVENAPFFVGSELNPVNGKPFLVCYETTSANCIPPVEVLFFD